MTRPPRPAIFDAPHVMWGHIAISSTKDELKTIVGALERLSVDDWLAIKSVSANGGGYDVKFLEGISKEAVKDIMSEFAHWLSRIGGGGVEAGELPSMPTQGMTQFLKTIDGGLINVDEIKKITWSKDGRPFAILSDGDSRMLANVVGVLRKALVPGVMFAEEARRPKAVE
jgi:hypothetical protein